MAKRFSSVQDLIQDTFGKDDPGFTKEAVEYIAQHRIGKILANMREHAKLSQGDVAKACSWTQSKVSKVEAQADDKFSMEEIRLFLNAVGMSMEIHFMPKRMKLSEKVKYYYGIMFSTLRQIANFGKDDPQIQQGTNKFMMEATLNIVEVAKFCLDSVKAPSQEETIGIVEPDFKMEDMRQEALT